MEASDGAVSIDCSLMAMAAAFLPSGCAPPIPITIFNPTAGTHLAPFTLHFRLRPRRAAATATLREVCAGRVPDHVLQRTEEVGYVVPTEAQEQSLPLLLPGQDCILHAQTGSGKTLAYLLSVFSAIDFSRSSVQALVVVPTRELGIQVTKVARLLAAKVCTVMALLDGGMLKRQKSWVKAEPPAIIVATVPSLCQMVERRVFSLQSVRVLVIDEVDFIFGSSKQVSSLLVCRMPGMVQCTHMAGMCKNIQVQKSLLCNRVWCPEAEPGSVLTAKCCAGPWLSHGLVDRCYSTGSVLTACLCKHWSHGLNTKRRRIKTTR